MNNLSNYLKLHGFEYHYTSIADTANAEEFWIDYEQELTELNLTLDKSNWVTPCIGNYCQERDLLQPDGFHPSMQGHEAWTRTVLIPYLNERDVLCQQ